MSFEIELDWGPQESEIPDSVPKIKPGLTAQPVVRNIQRRNWSLPFSAPRPTPNNSTPLVHSNHPGLIAGESSNPDKLRLSNLSEIRQSSVHEGNHANSQREASENSERDTSENLEQRQSASAKKRKLPSSLSQLRNFTLKPPNVRKKFSVPVGNISHQSNKIQGSNSEDNMLLSLEEESKDAQISGHFYKGEDIEEENKENEFNDFEGEIQCKANHPEIDDRIEGQKRSTVQNPFISRKTLAKHQENKDAKKPARQKLKKNIVSTAQIQQCLGSFLDKPEDVRNRAKPKSPQRKDDEGPMIDLTEESPIREDSYPAPNELREVRNNEQAWCDKSYPNSHSTNPKLNAMEDNWAEIEEAQPLNQHFRALGNEPNVGELMEKLDDPDAPWWKILPDFVPLNLLANGVNPRTGAVVYIDYAKQFQEAPDSPNKVTKTRRKTAQNPKASRAKKTGAKRKSGSKASFFKRRNFAKRF